MKVSVKLPHWRIKDPDEVLKAVAGTLYKEATNIMADSKENYVPVDTGNLRSSGIVDLPKLTNNRVVVELGYGGPAAPYALAVHENPWAGNTGGVSPSGKRYRRWSQVGQWKYLEIPFREALVYLDRLVARSVAKARMKNVPP